MIHHPWFLAVLLLLSVLHIVKNTRKIVQADRDRQFQLVGPLRWQIVGHALFLSGWLIALIYSCLHHSANGIAITLIVALWIIGMVALVYGQRREQVQLAA